MRDDEARGLPRRDALKCMGWAGTGALFTLGGGIAASVTLDRALAATPRHPAATAHASFSFVQVSDSHIGFAKEANPDPLATLRETIAKIAALPVKPDFVVHTGDITHLAKPDQFDLAKQVFGEIGVPVHFLPGEHDIAEGTDPRPYLGHFGAGTTGEGWYSFEQSGAHFVALVNVVRLGDRGMGTLGKDQLAWLARDLAGHTDSTPIVVLSHFPLWQLYPDWGWGTEDGLAALRLLRRFGSVTALNGHIHQIQRKVEGHMTFHAARSTAYPQPAPGVGPGPGPLTLPAARLRSAIGLSRVSLTHAATPIAILDSTLA